jgi:ribosome-binding protein aMBF1 (putative translation factor)
MRLRLTEERERRGWSKAALARAAGLDQALLGKIGSDRVQPYEVQLRRLARALELPIQQPNSLLDPARDVATERDRRTVGEGQE